MGFDAGDLGVKMGDIVSVSSTLVRAYIITSPRGSSLIVPVGEHNPTFGKLVALNMEETVLEVTGQSGTIRCHFPRYGYAIKSGDTKP